MELQSNLKKLYRHTNKILNLEDSPNPISLVFMVTSACNLNCSFCYVGNRDRSDSLKLEDIKRFVEITKPKSVEISGGEPCLYEDLVPLIDFLYEKNIEIGMFSNGVLINNIPNKTLKKLTWLRISINHIIENNISWNAPRYPEFLGYVYIYHDYDISKQEIDQFLENHRGKYFKIHEDVTDKRDIPMSLVSEGIIAQGDREKEHYKGQCYMGIFKPFIEPDGKIYCCSCLVDEESKQRDYGAAIGHIKNPEEFTKYREIHKDCKNCKLYAQNRFADYIRKDKVKHENFI